MKKPRLSKGFTLIEMIMSLIIFIIIAELAGPLLAIAVDSISYRVDRVDLEESGNLALARMSREIRRLRNNQSVVSATATEFEFVDRDNVQIRYRLAGNSLMRRQGAVENALADQVQAGGLGFTYLNDDGSAIATPAVGLGTNTNIRRVQIQIIFQNGNHVMTFQTQVMPRNVRHEAEMFG